MTGSSEPTERVVALAPDQSLVGVWTDAERDRSSDKPAVIFLNAGVIHRVGPHRLHVVLARTLARRGFCALRFDLSGIGDSRPMPGDRTFRESAVADTRTVMDQLAKEGDAERFVLFGLCSGADNALATAAVDRRVAAIVIVDPPAYATRRSRVRALADRSRRIGGVAVIEGVARAAVRRARARLRRAFGEGAGAEGEPAQGRVAPPREEYRALLRDLTARGVRVFCIYSAARATLYNAEGQLFEAFPELRGKVDVAYFAEANHVFTERAMQTALIDTVVRWLERTFP